MPGNGEHRLLVGFPELAGCVAHPARPRFFYRIVSRTNGDPGVVNLDSWCVEPVQHLSDRDLVLSGKERFRDRHLMDRMLVRFSNRRTHLELAGADGDKFDASRRGDFALRQQSVEICLTSLGKQFLHLFAAKGDQFTDRGGLFPGVPCVGSSEFRQLQLESIDPGFELQSIFVFRGDLFEERAIIRLGC